jgi:hypothetical protein
MSGSFSRGPIRSRLRQRCMALHWQTVIFEHHDHGRLILSFLNRFDLRSWGLVSRGFNRLCGPLLKEDREREKKQATLSVSVSESELLPLNRHFFIAMSVAMLKTWADQTEAETQREALQLALRDAKLARKKKHKSYVATQRATQLGPKYGREKRGQIQCWKR